VEDFLKLYYFKNMHYINTYPKNEKATVCINKTCLTVHGDTAKIINGIAIAAATLMFIALLDKVLR
jgi:hypothetical protein